MHGDRIEEMWQEVNRGVVTGRIAGKPHRRQKDPLNLSGFVEGRSWYIGARVGIAETHVFSHGWLAHGKEIRSVSARFYALQSVIN